MPNAIDDIAAERRRQIEAEGWTPEHDDRHEYGEMAYAAACYALASRRLSVNAYIRLTIERLWPWDVRWFKSTNARRNLVKAAALIAAEIERLDRAEARRAAAERAA